MSSLTRRARPGTQGLELDVRNNSLNVIRLVLAAMVLVAHSFPLSGRGEGPLWEGEGLGGWAVFGFFAISGYLITASRFANPLGNYLVKRAARIFPAFLVCNVLTAFAFAPIARVIEGRSIRTLLTSDHSPANYVWSNATLRMAFYDIGGGPRGIPYPGAWNGSLWSLNQEFRCYLVIGVIAGFAVMRKPLAMGFAFAVSVLFWVLLPHISPFFGGDAQLTLLARLLPVFLGGAVLQTVVKRLRLTWPLALGAVAGAYVLITMLDRGGPQLASPLVTLVILWLARVVPSPALLQQHDISYGFYIYAFPVQQLLATVGLHRQGLLPYMLAAAGGTAVLATASWLLIERPVLRAVARSRGMRRRPSPTAGEAAEPSHELTTAGGVSTMAGAPEPDADVRDNSPRSLVTLAAAQEGASERDAALESAAPRP